MTAQTRAQVPDRTLTDILRNLTARHEVEKLPSETIPPAVEPTMTLGMSPTELAQTLKMCGFQAGEEDVLPPWFSLFRCTATY